MSQSPSFQSPPPEVPLTLISFPSPHVLLVTFNRPKQLNAFQRRMHYDLDKLWTWYENEPNLRCAVITGAGRAFCAGADLKEWHNSHQETAGSSEIPPNWTDQGFGGLSNRRGKKPIISAVNGLCLGGGMEMAINTDIILASESAQFGLPEVTKGVVAIAGALPRLTKLVGRTRASEMALMGRTYTAAKLEEWGIVNRVVRSPMQVLEEALRWAEEIAANSPDAVLVSREGLLGGWGSVDPHQSTLDVGKGIYTKIDGKENMKEGVLSFVERRKPVWKDSKL